MKTTSVLFLIVGLGVILLISSVCSAASIKTKIFYKDLQKCEKFIDGQYNLLMEFLNALTPEDVKLINASRSYDKIELLNPKAISLFKELDKTDDSREPKGVKHAHGIPRNFLEGEIQNVANYSRILKLYNIPQEDYNEVFDSYSNYVIDLLDKIQSLRDKVSSLSLTIHRFPTINGIFLVQRDFLLFFTNYNPMFESYPGGRLQSSLLRGWDDSCVETPELYQNKSVLTAQKLWIEFVLSNDDLLTNRDGDKSYDEEYMTELDKIERRLVKLSGTPAKQQESAKETINKSEPAKQTSPTTKPKFKLDLPK